MVQAKMGMTPITYEDNIIDVGIENISIFEKYYLKKQNNE